MFKDEKQKPSEDRGLAQSEEADFCYSQASVSPPAGTSFLIKTNRIVQLAVVILMVKPLVTIVSFLENAFNHYCMVLMVHLSHGRATEDTTEDRAQPS